MDDPRYDFLPHARLTLQARRGVRRRDLDRPLQNGAPRRRLADRESGEADAVDRRVEAWFARRPFHLATCNCCMLSPAADPQERTHGVPQSRAVLSKASAF